MAADLAIAEADPGLRDHWVIHKIFYQIEMGQYRAELSELVSNHG